MKRQQDHDGGDLLPQVQAHQEVTDQIRRRNLGQRVVKLQVRATQFNRDHDLTDDHEPQTADQHMTGGAVPAGLAFPAPCEGKGHGNSDHEQEGRHDEVVEDCAAPRPMLELLGDIMVKAAVRKLREPETIGYQQNHDQPAIGVEGQEARLGLRAPHDFAGLCRGARRGGR